MAKIDFSKITGSKTVKSEKEQAVDRVKEQLDEKKLEKEIKEFHSLPKEHRVKKSDGFDFKQITKQIKKHTLIEKKQNTNWNKTNCWHLPIKLIFCF
ncbi:MAG: hypothetical protein Q7S21_05790 [archaeon]|nr:hypothetical protein [archaeon]